MLGMVRSMVDRLAVAGRLPYVETGAKSPMRLYRRAQIEVIACAIRARLEGVEGRRRISVATTQNSGQYERGSLTWTHTCALFGNTARLGACQCVH